MERRRSEDIVREDLEALYLGNLHTVETDLSLPERGKNGSALTWESGESRFLENDGRVHRPFYGTGNRKVILTVTARWGETSARREFEVTILQRRRENIVESIRLVEISAAPGEPVHLPHVVIVRCSDGRRTTLPVQWDPVGSLPQEGEVRLVEGAVEGTRIRAQARITLRSGKKREETPTARVQYFPLSEVRLLPGTIYWENQQRMVQFLLSVDDDQMLCNFRKNAGLDVGDTEPMTGWEAADCQLKGHTTGHYLSALALAWAATGERRFREKIQYMVHTLGACQDALEARGDSHPGFLSAYPEDQFDQLECYTLYPEIWAPYYTLDKIMAGLLDCAELADEKEAVGIVSRMGDWVYARLSRLPEEQRTRMWSLYIAGEFGGMIDTMGRLYTLTGKEEHRKAAGFFYNEKLFYPMEEGCDTLEDMHANQHIPQIRGAMRLYTVTGEEKYWKIAKNFWEIVTGGHLYSIGGVGESELFHAAGSTCSYLTERAAESCASYNMLRLTGQIFPYVCDGAMMDYYGNTLCNHIMTSCSREPDGGTTYFLPLEPGGRKSYDTAENTCCHGTGLESRFRYMENLYAYDGESIWVNLAVDSVLSGILELRTGDEGEMTVHLIGDLDKNLKIHLPAWAREKVTASVRGREITDLSTERGYLVCEGPWKAGDEIVLKFPMDLRTVENTSDRNLVCLARGEQILAALDDSKDFLPVPHPGEGKSPKIIPLNRVDREAYHVYFRRQDA